MPRGDPAPPDPPSAGDPSHLPMSVGARVGRAVARVGGATFVVLAVVSGAATIIDLAGDAGVWQACWRNWSHEWGALLAVTLWHLVAVSAVCCAAGPPEDGDWQGIQWVLGGVAPLVAVIDALVYPRLVGSAVFGGVTAIAATCLWTVGWIRSRRREGGVSAKRAVLDGLVELGGQLTWLRDLVVGALHGPRGRRAPDSDEEVRRLAGAAAVVAGAAVVAFGACVVFGAGTVAAYAVSSGVAVVRDDEGDDQAEGLGGRDGRAEETTTTTSTSSGESSTTTLPTSGSSTTAAPLPGPDCDRFEVGVGPDIDDSVLAAAAEALPDVDEVFTLCPLGVLEYDPAHDLYRQPVATFDGDRGIYVVAFVDGAYTVTFVSPDDGAAYAEVEADPLDIGTPLPFRPCDGLWLQPFVTPEGLVAGIGTRAAADEDEQADRPIFIWGATVEVLLERHGRVLMPVGSPVDEDRRQYQGFEGGLRVDDALETAEGLRIEALMASCSG